VKPAGLVRWLLTAGLLAVVLTQAPPDQWLPTLTRVRWAPLSLAGLMMAGIVLVNTWKWSLLLEVQGIRPGFLRLAYHYTVGYFFNSFLTGTGDLKRATDLGREQEALPQVMASVLAERWSGTVGQLALASVTLLVAFLRNPEALWPLTLASAGLCAALVLGYLWFESARPGGSEVGKGSSWSGCTACAWRSEPYRGRAEGRGGAAWFCPWWLPLALVGIHVLLARALDLDAPLLALLLFVPTVSVFAQLPVTINGFGLQDWFMVTLLGETMTPAQAMALSMLFHALRLATGASGGVLYALAPNLGRRP